MRKLTTPRQAAVAATTQTRCYGANAYRPPDCSGGRNLKGNRHPGPAAARPELARRPEARRTARPCERERAGKLNPQTPIPMEKPTLRWLKIPPAPSPIARLAAPLQLAPVRCYPQSQTAHSPPRHFNGQAVAAPELAVLGGYLRLKPRVSWVTGLVRRVSHKGESQ